MAKRTIYVIGLELPDVEGFECYRVNTDISLLDADVVLFRPMLDEFDGYGSEQYQGRTLLSQHASFQVMEKISHWTGQLKTAVETGKTVVVLLPERKEIYRYTGEVRTSGTGRSQVRTNIVNPVNNYQLIPWRFDDLVSGTGQAMRLAAKADIIAGYWRAFENISVYNVHFSTKATSLLVTKSGNKTVGAAARATGNLLLLPDLHWDSDAFVNKAGTEWTKAASAFAYSLRDEILALDAVLRAGREVTPEPGWAQVGAYRLSIEDAIEARITKLTARIEEATKQRESSRLDLKKSTTLRALLYEKGPILEAAVREALVILGFQADGFKNGDSEFDAVFTSSEGRFLGEVEGKDNKAIAIEKYSQLERNINEDLQRDEIASPAKAVLFGNAFRLTPISEREEFFTEKVRSAAARTGAALVRTPDLFIVARHLKNQVDEVFAAECRKAMADAIGSVVKFPTPPAPAEETRGEAA